MEIQKEAFGYTLKRNQLLKYMLVIIDSGHGINTPGKCSPDKQFKEWKYCRELADLLSEALLEQDFGVVNLMHGIDNDESLRSRCNRINKIVAQNKNCIVISLHNNAAGADGKWHNATGWSVFVSMNASANSKLAAQLLCESAIKHKVMGNRSIPKCKYWQKDLAICRDTKCPAVLIEHMFMDNKDDVAFLESTEGKQTLVQVIVDGLEAYRKEKNLK